MNYIHKIGIQSINEYIPENSAFICFASFEKRCITLANIIDLQLIDKAYIFRNCDEPMRMYNNDNAYQIKERIKVASTIEVSINKPVSIAENVLAVTSEIIRSAIKNVIVDISTFTHEALIILIKNIFIYRSFFDSILLVYNGASEYADWLSKGCKYIRNVIGYPGLFRPSHKDHLIILTGFEKERATQLVELFEPDILSVGNGIDPTEQNHINTMDTMKNEFEIWFRNLGIRCDPFNFSCSDITSTIQTIKNQINKYKDVNTVLVPLNTKLSTVSAAMVALQNPQIQVIYPIPEVYNLSYSKPSKNFTVVNFKELMNL